MNECAQQIIPSLILLFDGLKRAYAAKVLDTDDEENEDDDSDIDEGNYHQACFLQQLALFLSNRDNGLAVSLIEVLSSDEDEIDDASQEYLEKLQEKVSRSSTQHGGFNVSGAIQDGHGDHGSDDDGDDSEYDANEETPLECFVTPLDSEDTNQDEYIVFKEVMQSKRTFRSSFTLIHLGIDLIDLCSFRFTFRYRKNRYRMVQSINWSIDFRTTEGIAGDHLLGRST